MFDFLSGAVYVLAASMKRIAQNVFILAPYGVEVETQERPNDSYTTTNKDT
ncbi:MAG: cell division protein SepF [Clostridia bacterium]